MGKLCYKDAGDYNKRPSKNKRFVVSESLGNFHFPFMQDVIPGYTSKPEFPYAKTSVANLSFVLNFSKNLSAATSSSTSASAPSSSPFSLALSIFSLLFSK